MHQSEAMGGVRGTSEPALKPMHTRVATGALPGSGNCTLVLSGRDTFEVHQATSRSLHMRAVYASTCTLLTVEVLAHVEFPGLLARTYHWSYCFEDLCTSD